VRNLPTNSALGRELYGEAVDWSTDTYLMASAIDLLAGANWQRGGGKSRRPKPVPRPRLLNIQT
jgi:hypothetical protein